MSAPRVLHLRSSRGHAGPEQHLLELAPALVDQGYAASLALLHRRGHDDGRHPTLSRAGARGVDAHVVDDAHHRTTAAVTATQALAERLDAALLHAHDVRANAVALAAARRTGLPAVATVHLHTRQGWRLRLHRQLDLLLLRHFAAVLAVSPSLVDDLPRWSVPRNRLHVVPNGLDAAALRQSAAARQAPHCLDGITRPLLLGAGRLTRQKGFDLLLRAMPDVLRRHPQATLVLAGDGPERTRLAAAAHSLGDRVRFLGERDDIPALLARADVVVAPSRREGLPYVLLEAMALARPVVATAAGGIPTLIEDGRTGRVVPVDDPAALIAAMLDLLDDPAAAASLGAAGERRVTTSHDAATMARRTAAIYDTVLGRAEELGCAS